MRELRNKKEITNWFCGKCDRILNTPLKFLRKKCCECGMYMETLTEAELQYHRNKLRRLLIKRRN